MSDEKPDYSLKNAGGSRDQEAPSLMLVRHFRVKEADYMKPPLQEQLLEPDGSAAPTASGNVSIASACTCNAVCTCVPVSTCACNTVCTCNTVSRTHGLPMAATAPTAPYSGGGRTCYGGGGGGYGGYWAPCF